MTAPQSAVKAQRWCVIGKPAEIKIAENDLGYWVKHADHLASRKSDGERIAALEGALEVSERDRLSANEAFQALWDETESDAAATRAAGVTYRNVRDAMEDHDHGDISFGRLVEIMQRAVGYRAAREFANVSEAVANIDAEIARLNELRPLPRDGAGSRDGQIAGLRFAREALGAGVGQ